MIRQHRITSKDLALASVRLQPSAFSQPGAASNIRSNSREQRVTVTFPATANAPKVIFHNLGFAPTGYSPLGSNVACRVFSDLPLRSTSRVIVLKCDTANAVVDILVR